MGMTRAGLESELIAEMNSVFAPWDNPADDHRVTLTAAQWRQAMAKVISIVVPYIQGNAKVSGTDTRGDTLVTAGTSIS